MIDVSTRITSWGARVVTIKGHQAVVEVSWQGNPDLRVFEAAYQAVLDVRNNEVKEQESKERPIGGKEQ